MQRLDLVAGWLDKIARLPLGHPDRLRFLTYAEQILEGSAPAAQCVVLDPETAPVLSRAEQQ